MQSSPSYGHSYAIPTEIGETDLESSSSSMLPPPAYMQQEKHSLLHEEERNDLAGYASIPMKQSSPAASAGAAAHHQEQNEEAIQETLETMKVESHKFASVGIFVLTAFCTIVSYSVTYQYGSISTILVVGCAVAGVLAAIFMANAKSEREAVVSSGIHFVLFGIALGVLDGIIRKQVYGFGAFTIASNVMLEVQLIVWLLMFLRKSMDKCTLVLIATLLTIASFGMDMGIAYATGVPLWFPAASFGLVGGTGVFVYFHTEDRVKNLDCNYAIYGAKFALIYYVVFIIAPLIVVMAVAGVNPGGLRGCDCQGCNCYRCCNEDDVNRRSY